MSDTKTNSLPFVIIISGPTGSGKTDLSEKIAQSCNGEIINADVGQFYTTLSIGTAKPDWQNDPVPQHCFDIITEPKDLTVVEYANIVLQKIADICKKGKIPIIVGGSLFYIKSLFFPPQSQAGQVGQNHAGSQMEDSQTLWKRLKEIDAKRAEQLHPNDRYRVQRALQIWEKTGIKPSDYKPTFAPPFHACFIFINQPKDVIDKRINDRTLIMLEQGWIEETKALLGTEWEIFLKKKGLIGYKEILDWIKQGENKKTFFALVETIQQKTRQYAKRQKTFWKSFKRDLQDASKKDATGLSAVIETEQINEKELHRIQKRLEELFALKKPLSFP